LLSFALSGLLFGGLWLGFWLGFWRGFILVIRVCCLFFFFGGLTRSLCSPAVIFIPDLRGGDIIRLYRMNPSVANPNAKEIVSRILVITYSKEVRESGLSTKVVLVTQHARLEE